MSRRSTTSGSISRPKEFQLLEYFLLHPEEVVRRTTLLEKVWDMHFDPESNVVDVHVGNLRRKLSEAAGEQLLTTVRGVGFSLRRGGRAGDLARGRSHGSRRRVYLLPAGALLFILSGLLVRMHVGRSALPPCLWSVGLALTGAPVVWQHPPRRRSRAASPPISWPCSPSSPPCCFGSRWRGSSSC